MAAPHIDLRLLPNLPGFSLPTYKERNFRPQTWNVVNNQRIEQKEGLTHERTKFVKAARPPDQWRSGSLPDSATRATFKQAGNLGEEQELPAWDALDRHVLRFTGYFKESVVETNLENYRVRKVVFYYYLEDDTCQVTEPRQDNSGIPQGQLIRRHRFPSPSGDGYLKPEDLQVGGVLQIYGRRFMVTDCDPFTRAYYERVGMPQAEPQPEETDPFMETRAAMKVVHATQPRTYEKIYREVMLGGGHINADMQQFMENDRKVLRFYAVMDDVSTPQFERRPFLIMFFLADDKLEIREQYPLNCGRDNFPIFFRKNKMPIGAYKVEGPQSQARKKSDYVHGYDFRVNMNVTLLGNYHFFIYDADDFTRRHFIEEVGVELEPMVQVQLPTRTVPRAKTPPYTGYGSWEDSLSSVTQLIPKPPKRNMHKLFENEGKVLRFKAKFLDPKPEDVNRIFVISFYLMDDSLSIHEPPQRNLGIVTGRFLEKGVHINQITGKLFQPDDLLPGSVAKVYNHEFYIMEMDEYTAKLMPDPSANLREVDLESVLQKLRESLRQQFPLARDIFRRFDADHDGVITVAEFRRVLEKFGFNLREEEVLLVMRHFDTRRDGQISYNEFCDALLDEDYTTEMLKTKAPVDTSFDPDYADRARVKSLERRETAEVRKAVQEIGGVLYRRHGFLNRAMREFGHVTHLSHVTVEQVQQVFANLGHHFELEDMKRAALYALPGCDLEAIEYLQLLRALVVCFHDVSAPR